LNLPLIGQGIKPLLAGRNEKAIVQIAKKYKCSYKVFDLNDHEKINNALGEVHTLLNCAGPFKYTARKLMNACVSTKTNYLDITGEIDVIETAWALNDQAKAAEITILPSIGFDVIPTDCLAKKLSEKIDNPLKLELGIKSDGGISRGTMLTTLEMMSKPGKIRRNGKIIDSPIGEFENKVDNKNFKMKGISIPWGDVSSAYYSTRIPNITVYLGFPKGLFGIRKIIPLSKRILSIKFIQKIIFKLVGFVITGPSKKKRETASTYVWGRVENNNGESIEEAYKLIDGYNITAIGAADALTKFVNGKIDTGTKTPSLAFGKKLVKIILWKNCFNNLKLWSRATTTRLYFYNGESYEPNNQEAVTNLILFHS